MSQATPKKNDSTALATHVGRGLREAALIIASAIAVYLLIALLSYDPTDPAWSHSRAFDMTPHNAGGIVGAWFADVFLFLFGYLAYLVPIMVAGAGWLLFRGRNDTPEQTHFPHMAIRGVGFLLTISAGSGLAALHFADAAAGLPFNAGGVLGQIVSSGLVSVFSFLGATLFVLALLLTGISLFTGLSWLHVIDATGRVTLNSAAFVRSRWSAMKERRIADRARKARSENVKTTKAKVAKRQPPRIEATVKTPKPSVRVVKEKQIPLLDPPATGGLPSLSLLDPPERSKNNISKEALEATSRLVELKLKDFGIEVQVVAVLPGPVITRYEIQPAPGVKVSQITNLAKDLARSLSVISVRVVEVIPGKSVVGLEIPNEHREIVRLIEVLQSKEYGDAHSPLTLALGKDISGYPMVADLARMPHLLVAGTTGSGKSVAVNAMVLSLLFNATPEQVRLIMIDPKMLELSIYEGIPHLLAPVVTDMKEAAYALRWCVAEMERRYKLMAALGVRNITGYNRKVKEATEKGQPLKDPLFRPQSAEDEAPELETLPYIVVIVDELADMMMIVGKKVEEFIARLAQKARAAGIHLVLATQRPSVDVITGLIKANIPTRIAFQVSSKIDSRTILDQMGAEQLLGHGDMLYLPPGTGLPVRVHGAFVADQEVHKVVEDLKRRGEPNYIEEVLSGPEEEGGDGAFPGDGEAEADPLYDQAVRIVTESRRASISGIQRRLKIGYNRAARMVEDMERAGVVGPLQSNGQREVLAAAPPD